MKTCKGSSLIPINPENAIVAPSYDGNNPITTNCNNNITNNSGDVNVTNIGNQNNTIIMNFPNGIEDQEFAFLKDHISTGRFESLIANKKPEIGFSRYVGALLERPENRVIYKTNPNVKNCKIHNDGQWEYVLDKDAFPVLTFHMSCAALEDTHKYKTISKRPKIDIVSLLQYLDDVNTENDENENYKEAIERVKLLIVNLSQRVKVPISEEPSEQASQKEVIVDP
jgi:hypothetical protein